MSVCGHLIVVAAMVTMAAVVFDVGPRLVAPDRIEIYEIDLENVTVSGDETKLFNTAADVKPKVEPKPEPKPDPKPEPVAEKQTPQEIVEPTLTEPEKQDQVQEQKPDPKPETKIDNPSPAPKKRTVVRVNRETVGLNRTLTISVRDALRVALSRCWNIDTKHPGISDIRAVAHLTMRKNGTVRDVWFESASRAETDPGFAYVLETIRGAINVCQPFRMLPANEYAAWEKIQLTFYPTQGQVM